MEYGQVLLWWVAFQALALLGLPIAALLMPRFVDRGAAFGLPIALAVLATVVYWLGHLRFTWLTLFAAVATLGALAAGSVWRGATVEWRKHGEVVAVFTIAFALLVAIRAFDPAVSPGAGEKFLDYGLLKSLLRATQLPPQDMWFAGEPVQYYYGGHLIAALLAKLTSTPANYAYNLALAGFYAMAVTAAYGLAGAIADEHGVDNRIAGGLAAFFVGFASNVSTAFALLLGALPTGIAATLAGLFGTTVEEFATTPSDFSYWSASRVIEGTVNEFPLFAFLNGDMHAHMMSPPFLLLVAALLYGYFRTPAANLTRRRALVFGVIPVVSGLVAVINTWSWPSTLGLTFLTLALGRTQALDLFSKSLGDRLDGHDGWLAREATRIGGGLAGTAVVGALSLAWVVPFFLNTASGRGLGFFPDRSPMSGLFLVHGAFLVVFGLYLLSLAWPEDREPVDEYVAVGALLVGVGWLGNLAAVVIVGPLLVLGWYLLRRGDASYEAVLVVAGAGLVLLVEFVFVQENAGPDRYNTVFKTYAQVWILWATALGVALPRAVSSLRTHASLPGSAKRRGRIAAVFVAVLLVSVSLYGGLALGKHFNGGRTASVPEPTLDATQFVERSHPGEAPAIAWLDDREGQPTILTEPGMDMYRWTNAPASLTGLPTVAGWYHEVGYRNYTVFNERVQDVNTMYEGPEDRRIALLDEYDVEYVYVGPQERERYGTVDFSGLPGVSVAFENDAVTIYQVDQSALSG